MSVTGSKPTKYVSKEHEARARAKLAAARQSRLVEIGVFQVPDMSRVSARELLIGGAKLGASIQHGQKEISVSPEACVGCANGDVEKDFQEADPVLQVSDRALKSRNGFHKFAIILAHWFFLFLKRIFK